MVDLISQGSWLLWFESFLPYSSHTQHHRWAVSYCWEVWIKIHCLHDFLNTVLICTLGHHCLLMTQGFWIPVVFLSCLSPSLSLSLPFYPPFFLFSCVVSVMCPCLLMQTLASTVHVLWLQQTNSHELQKSCGEKGTTWPLSEWETGPRPLPGQAFIAFLGTLCWGWSSFNMHRFAVGDYFLQITKERMLLITSKRRMLQIKGKSGWTGYTPHLGGLA